METKKLKNILKKHLKWLNNEIRGEKADLRYANLQSADLRAADICIPIYTDGKIRVDEAKLIDIIK